MFLKLVLGVVGALLIALVLRGGFAGSSGPNDRPGVAGPIPVQTLATSSADTSSVQIESPVESAPTMRDAFDILDQAISANPAPAATNAPYLEKYRGATDDELVIARFALDKKTKSERTRIGNEILASGAFKTYDIAEGQSLPASQATKECPAKSFVFSAEPKEGGGLIYKFAEIDPETYPDFHALEMELRWVQGEVIHRGLETK